MPIRCTIMTLSVLGIALAAPSAQAHLTLLDPSARTAATALTDYPCGGTAAGGPVKSYQPGSDIVLSVDLVVDHVNRLQAYISDDGFTTRTELATITTSGTGVYELNARLPPQVAGAAVIQVTDGTYVSCADVLLTEDSTFSINAGLNDAWYMPETAGQGFLIVIFPDLRQVFLAWFTYDTLRPPEDAAAILGEPGHRWLTAQGPYEGNLAVLDIVVTEGGVFDSSEPAAQNSAPGSVGTVELEFENCSKGIVRYSMSGLGLEGEIPIERIVDDNVALCEALALESGAGASD